MFIFLTAADRTITTGQESYGLAGTGEKGVWTVGGGGGGGEGDYIKKISN